MSQFTTTTQAGSEGLVQSHKNGREPYFPLAGDASVSIFADLLTVKVTGQAGERPRSRGDRRSITTFTKRSRKHMLEELAKLRNPTGGFFCTLTYPGHFDYSPAEVKVHLERFRKAFLRQFPEAGYFWRLELKERRSGASKGVLVPHFHLLCFLHEAAMPLSDFREWLAATWWRCVASGDFDHRHAGTQADLILNRKHAARYASKYAAKEEDSTKVLPVSHSHWGRRWGKAGRLDLDAAMLVTISLRQLHELRRLASKLLKSKGRGYAKRLHRQNGQQGFTVFGLGDLSFGWDDFTDSTIVKMLLSL